MEFELYCIILISCRMLPREDEIGSVEDIAFEIQGKADPAPMTLMMWFDHQMHEFCPAYHLLAFFRNGRN
jgi:hypothetical protein